MCKCNKNGIKMNNRQLKKFIDRTLGKNIKNFRLERGFSQEYVAKKMEISLKKYKKLEKGYFSLTVLHLFYLREIFNIPVYIICEGLD